MPPDPHWLEQRFKDLFPATLGKPQATGDSSTEPRAMPEDLDRYIAAAVRGVLSDLRRATEGERNNILNISAYRLGRFVSGGNLSEGTAYAWLEGAAESIGLARDEIGRTIRSGLEAGKSDPFTLTTNDYKIDSGAPNDHEHLAAPTELPRPVDWSKILSDETPDVDWLIDGIIERGRLHALFAPSKSHKSLIVQYLCAELAQAAVIMYLDFENSQADLKLRFGPRGMQRTKEDLSNLLYFLFPALSALDTPSGGAQLAAMAEEYAPELVIIDTTSRVIGGKENDSDTFRALYRYALASLKARGIAVVRIDHAGKDVQLGQRGSSAKSDDVDTVWLLVPQGEDRFTLRCTHQRTGNHPEVIGLRKVINPLRFEREDDRATYGGKLTVPQIAKALDRIGVPLDMGRDKLFEVIKASGINASLRTGYDAQVYRRELAEREKESAALTLDIPNEPSSLPSSPHFEQDHDSPGHYPVHLEQADTKSPDRTPVHPSSSPEPGVNQGAPEGARAVTGGAISPPVPWPPDTAPPERPTGPVLLDKEERDAIESLLGAGIKFRVVK